MINPYFHWITSRELKYTFYGVGFISNENTDYWYYRSRNIAAGTSDMISGSSALGNGNIYLVYE